LHSVCESSAKSERAFGNLGAGPGIRSVSGLAGTAATVLLLRPILWLWCRDSRSLGSDGLLRVNCVIRKRDAGRAAAQPAAVAPYPGLPAVGLMGAARHGCTGIRSKSEQPIHHRPHDGPCKAQPQGYIFYVVEGLPLPFTTSGAAIQTSCQQHLQEAPATITSQKCYSVLQVPSARGRQTLGAVATLNIISSAGYSCATLCRRPLSSMSLSGTMPHLCQAVCLQVCGCALCCSTTLQ
jgi:hypothetical protein